MSDELKPCPFCGASGEVHTVYNSMFETNTYTVVCSNEDSCPVNYLSMKCHRTEQEAIEAWNTRIGVQTEIVRCKDCKHYDAYNSLCNKFGIDCYLATPQVNEKSGYEHTYGDYGYCAWGERKEVKR